MVLNKRNKRKPVGKMSRIVRISAHTVKLLLHLVNESKNYFTTDRVFLSSYGEPLGQNHFNKRLKYYARKSKCVGKEGYYPFIDILG